MPERYTTLAIDEAINRMESKHHTEKVKQWYFDQWQVPGCPKPSQRPRSISSADFEIFWNNKEAREARAKITKDASLVPSTQTSSIQNIATPLFNAAEIFHAVKVCEHIY
jgi:hypothetical protein